MKAKAINIWRPDAYGTLNTWLHRWEPRTKTMVLGGFVLGCVALNSLQLVCMALALVLAMAISSELPLGYILARLKWVLPFLVLMTVTVALGEGFTLSMERLTFALTLGTKALTSVLAMVLLLGTQPLQEYLDGLAHMGLPPVLLSAIFLAFRYVFLFGEELTNRNRALIARGFAPSCSIHTMKTYGEMAGGILLRTIDRSESVYQAMATRGFTGKMPTSAPRVITGSDLVKSVMVVLSVVLLLLLQWRWPV